MRAAALVLLLGTAGCAGREATDPLSSTGNQFTSPALQDTAMATEAAQPTTPTLQVPPAREIPQLVDLTVDPLNADEMKQLLPFLLHLDEKWKLLGVDTNPDTTRTWHFQWLGGTLPATDPLDYLPGSAVPGLPASSTPAGRPGQTGVEQFELDAFGRPKN